MRIAAAGLSLVLLGMAAVLILAACTIERVILYETVNYPMPRPT